MGLPWTDLADRIRKVADLFWECGTLEVPPKVSCKNPDRHLEPTEAVAYANNRPHSQYRNPSAQPHSGWN